MHDDAYIGGRSENNIKCVMHDDLWWKNQTTRYILLPHWLYECFSQFHSSGTYSVLSLQWLHEAPSCSQVSYLPNFSPMHASSSQSDSVLDCFLAMLVFSHQLSTRNPMLCTRTFLNWPVDRYGLQLFAANVSSRCVCMHFH